MSKFLAVVCLASLWLMGCHPGSNDPRVNTPTGVKSDTPGDSVITRTVGAVVDFFIRPGIEITEVIDRPNEDGFLEVQVSGFNHNRKRRVFDYRVAWLDKDGMVVKTPMTTWIPQSAMPQTTFSFKVIAPRPEIEDFRIETRRNKSSL
jgi:uncharacterized protein YcfL